MYLWWLYTTHSMRVNIKKEMIENFTLEKLKNLTLGILHLILNISKMIRDIADIILKYLKAFVKKLLIKR